MSRIYFHAEHEQAELLGSERAHFGMICRDLTDALYRRDGHTCEALRKFVCPTHWIAKESPDKFPRSLSLGLGTGLEDFLQWRGNALSSFEVVLNTALVLGSDAVRLAARLHGACEIHTWVDEANREWLAKIIDRGLADGIFRHHLHAITEGDYKRERYPLGWADVLTLLRSDSVRGPLVTSYSVCDQFPDRGSYARGTESADLGDAFYDLDAGDRWKGAMRGLRARGAGLELRPDGWDDFYFGTGITVLDLMAEDYEARLDRKLSKES